MHQEIPGSEHNAVRLLLFSLHRNEAHARSLRRFTDGFGICRVVLLPLHERLDVDRRDQAHTMAQLANLAGPIVRACTGFHGDDTGRLRRQEPKKLRACDALAE